jgi:hypothetical protein
MNVRDSSMVSISEMVFHHPKIICVKVEEPPVHRSRSKLVDIQYSIPTIRLHKISFFCSIKWFSQRLYIEQEVNILGRVQNSPSRRHVLKKKCLFQNIHTASIEMNAWRQPMSPRTPFQPICLQPIELYCPPSSRTVP